jgi:hypothetical protein
MDAAARYEDVLVLQSDALLDGSAAVVYGVLDYARRKGVEVRIVPRETFQILSGQKQRPT